MKPEELEKVNRAIQQLNLNDRAGEYRGELNKAVDYAESEDFEDALHALVSAGDSAGNISYRVHAAEAERRGIVPEGSGRLVIERLKELEDKAIIEVMSALERWKGVPMKPSEEEVSPKIEYIL